MILPRSGRTGFAYPKTRNFILTEEMLKFTTKGHESDTFADKRSKGTLKHNQGLNWKITKNNGGIYQNTIRNEQS